MRIFCAVRHSIDPKQYYGALWSANFYPALQELGHEIIESQIDLLPSSRFMDIPAGFTKEELAVRAKTTEHILSEVQRAQRKQNIDLFLSYFYNAHFDPSGFDELRRLGIPSVNYYCNSIHQLELTAAVAAEVDFAWHAERETRSAYLALGANPVCVQMGAEPTLCSPAYDVPRKPKICFVGQRYADRDRWVAHVLRAGLPIDVYGHGWGMAAASRSENRLPEPSYLGRPRSLPGSLRSYLNSIRRTCRPTFGPGLLRVANQLKYRQQTRMLSQVLAPIARGPAPNLAAVLSGYEVCLNFSNVWSDGRPGSRLVPHVRLRDFEAPMCRSCFLTGHTEEIAEYYDLGKEIDTYRSPEELADKGRFYLQNPDAAEKLREAGYRRALRDHTWRRRFEELFQKIGFSRVR